MITVTGFVYDASGAPVHARIHFIPQSTPILVSGGPVLASVTKTVKSNPSDGSFQVILEPGIYIVQIDTETRTVFRILVPQGNATMTIDEVLYSGANVLLPFAPLSQALGQAGHGNPNAALVGIVGQTYYDVDTGNFFINVNGATSWTQLLGNAPGGAFTALVAGSGSGVNLVFNGNPETFQVGSPGQLGFDQQFGTLWVKASGTGATGWRELIGNI